MFSFVGFEVWLGLEGVYEDVLAHSLYNSRRMSLPILRSEVVYFYGCLLAEMSSTQLFESQNCVSLCTVGCADYWSKGYATLATREVRGMTGRQLRPLVENVLHS